MVMVVMGVKVVVIFVVVMVVVGVKSGSDYCRSGCKEW